MVDACLVSDVFLPYVQTIPEEFTQDVEHLPWWSLVVRNVTRKHMIDIMTWVIRDVFAKSTEVDKPSLTFIIPMITIMKHSGIYPDTWPTFAKNFWAKPFELMVSYAMCMTSGSFPWKLKVGDQVLESFIDLAHVANVRFFGGPLTDAYLHAWNECLTPTKTLQQILDHVHQTEQEMYFPP